jgi:hypothetical protein
VTVNVLTVGKGSPKLTAANDADQTVRRINARKDREGKPFLEFIAGKATMATLAEMLQLATSRQFQYSFRIRQRRRRQTGDLHRASGRTRAEVGIGEEKMEVLVIDRAEKLTEN